MRPLSEIASSPVRNLGDHDEDNKSQNALDILWIEAAENPWGVRGLDEGPVDTNNGVSDDRYELCDQHGLVWKG